MWNFVSFFILLTYTYTCVHAHTHTETYAQIFIPDTRHCGIEPTLLIVLGHEGLIHFCNSAENKMFKRQCVGDK